MSNTRQGYLLPLDVANTAPEDLNCILVFYPDDERYLQALIGSISYLATWTAWERDELKRGTIAAQRWKDALDCTLDAMNCLADLITAVNGITGKLTDIEQEIADMNIVINNNGCGCDGGDIDDIIINLDNPTIIAPYGEPAYTDIVDPETGELTPDAAADFADVAAYDAAACELANSLYEDHYILFQRIETSIDMLVTLYDLATVILGAGTIKKAAKELGGEWFEDLKREFAEIVIKDWFTDGFLAAFLAYLETRKQDIVCHTYQNRGDLISMRDGFISQTYQAWLDAVGDQSLSPDDMAFATSWFYRYIKILIYPNRMFAKLAGQDVYPSPSAPIDCAACLPGTPEATTIRLTTNDTYGGENLNWTQNQLLDTWTVYESVTRFENASSGDYDLLWLEFSSAAEVYYISVSGWAAGSNATGLFVNGALVDAAPNGVYGPLSGVNAIRLNSGRGYAARLDFVLSGAA